MLKASKPNPRALIGMLGCGGMRIAEALSRKWSNFEVRPEGYARVALMAWETKARYLRYSFLTKECVDWLRIASPKETGFLFPGDDDGHLYYASVQYQVKEAFRNAGLVDSPTGFYTVHSLRTFADAQLRECGLDSKYVSAIIGHRNKLQSEASYLSWEAIEKAWVEKCSKKICFLSTYESREKADMLEKRNGKLELLLEKLLEMLT
jgi:integrase